MTFAGIRRGLIAIVLLLFFSCEANCLAQEKVTFCAVGDVLLDRGIRARIERNGMSYPFEKVTGFIKLCDLAFCNLECSISNRGDRLGKLYAFRADSSHIETLKKSGFNIFCLANNHTLDYGPQALMDTKRILEGAGFHTVGAGTNQKEASKAKIIEIKGVVFAFLAYVTFPLEAIAYSEDLPGPAQSDIDQIAEQIKAMKQRADFVVVSFHWGNEYSLFPSVKQEEYAHRAIDSGADLVIGHHPHVIQSIEKYEDKLIIYSLGNFIFDQNKPDGKEGLLFGCNFVDKEITSAYVVPIVIDSCRPTLAEEDDFQRIANRLKSICSGSNVKFKDTGKMLILE